MFYRKPGEAPGSGMIKYLIFVIKNLITDAWVVTRNPTMKDECHG